MNWLLGVIILFPLAGSVLLGLLYLLSFKMRVAKPLYTLIALVMPLGSFVVAALLFWAAYDDPNFIFHHHLFTWLSVGSLQVEAALLGDHLSLFMALFITFIGGLIHLYATGYMKGDEGYGKFFAYFHLFMASMLLLVLADNPLLMFVGWEGVGLCSYLLIGYYHQKNANVMAGNKAFIANRIGDFGFLIGLALLFFAVGAHGSDYTSLAENIGTVSLPMLTAIGLLLFVGAMGKSAQIPLYVWLPDAMAGPTPVSALIHAATMVTAGVYMVARFGFLYDLVPDVGLFIAAIGAASALLAAVIATMQSDIKKILAYSTMSQLGYMFVAVGLGAYDAGLFHVFTHAFFKALLFLGAGTVIVALHHEQDIFKMGGLARTMPLTFGTMAVATLALCGIPPFSGFFSKDAIMLTAFAKEHYFIWLITLVTAGLTAYYMTRLMVLTFIVPSQSHGELQAPSRPMQGVLGLLAIGSLLGGLAGVPVLFGGSNLLGSWLGSSLELHVEHRIEWALIGANMGAALLGITLAYSRFGTRPARPDETKLLPRLILNKFYVDELYHHLLVIPLKKLSVFFAHTVDLMLIDRAIHLLASGYKNLGDKAALMQNGNVRAYAFYMVAGISVIFIYLGWLL